MIVHECAEWESEKLQLLGLVYPGWKGGTLVTITFLKASDKLFEDFV